MNSIFRSSLCLFRSSVLSVSSVVKPFSNPSDSGSALILVLLITALLTTIAVSFLSTSRVEQIAAKNFSRQNAATGLAELATQQAMAKIQQGFTVTSNATTIITTQPGAITQFVFTNGNITSPTPLITGNAITYPPTASLFSGTGNASTNGTANLNNLQNPASNTTLTSNSTNNQWTITGNASEQINVPLENIEITENGTTRVVGRIAYYVDDEGTKLNVNAATDNRNTLNISSSKSLSLSASTTGNLSTANLTTFGKFAAGNLTSNNTSLLNWNHFFRHEQFLSHTYGNATLSRNATDLSINQTNDFRSALYKYTTVTPISDYHLKRTPWGTPRLFINDLPTDAANATASVNAIYNALSDTRLRDIYGSTFADKYTPLGLKQIAANILQMKDPNTNTASNSFNSTVPLIGANGSQLVSIANCCPTANATKLPAEYFGRAPYPYINEIGVTIGIAFRDFTPGKWLKDAAGNIIAWQWDDDNYNHNSIFGLQIRPFISIVNPELSTISKSQVDNWVINFKIDSFIFDMTHKNVKTGQEYTYTYGADGYENNDSWGHTFSEIKQRINKKNAKLGGTAKMQENKFGYSLGSFSTKALGNYSWSNADFDGVGEYTLLPWSQMLTSGQELQLNCYHYGGGWQMESFTLAAPNTSQIVDISNIKIKFEYIILSSVSGGTTTIRDFVLGKDVGYIDCWLQAPFPGDPTNSTNGWPNKALGDKSGHAWFFGFAPLQSDQVLPPKKSVKRIDGRLRLSANSTSSNSTRAWSASGNSSWVKNTVMWPAPMRAASTNATTSNAEAYPSVTQGNQIPGDPPVTNQTDPSYDFPAPFSATLQFTSSNTTTPNSSVFTSPQELGKVHTNAPHRKLRFTTQHPNEKSISTNATTIPDWAMLDVISFGSNVTTIPLPAPVNLNGKFYVPSTSPQPAARTAGLESVLKALDSATSVGSPFPPFTTANTTRSQYIGGSGNVSSTIAGNIGNLTWSTGNFTSGNSTWNSRRNAAKFPANQFVLPAEVTEIRSVSDVLPLDTYTGNSTNIKGNEGRLSALFPGATTQSRFFTIYAYAQAGQLQNKNQPESSSNPFGIDSEAVTKTLVEVVENTLTTPSTYTVKKLYTQPIQSQ